jgi:RNA polymerase sigma-70 factor (ECF subfamily)
MTAELVGRAKAGDATAFEALVLPSYDRLFALAIRIMRDETVAEDAVQDALIHAWREIRGLREPDRFDAWLTRLVVNACRDQARRSRRRPIEVAVLPIDGPPAREDAIADLADRDQLERGFRRLTVDQRAILVLHHYQGLRAPEIARVLGIPEGTVASRIHYATRAMRAALEADLRAVGPTRAGETA